MSVGCGTASLGRAVYYVKGYNLLVRASAVRDALQSNVDSNDRVAKANFPVRCGREKYDKLSPGGE